MRKISVLILDYHKAAAVRRNVETLKKQKGDFELEIFITDNSCDRQNEDVLKGLAADIVINSKNVGYTKANNQMAVRATGEYVLILNPDITWPNKKALTTLLQYLEDHSDVGIVGPKQINEGTGDVAMTVRKFPHFFTQIARRTWLRYIPVIKKCVQRDECKDFDYTKTQEVDWLQSSCLLIRRDLWNQIGGFDERYFLFLADTELCFQAQKQNKKVVYVAESQVTADGIRCSEGSFLDLFKKKVVRAHVKDAWRYFWKH